jgi:two-component system chemotaxis response regulator CheB
VKVITHLRARRRSELAMPAVTATPRVVAPPQVAPRLLVIGASTGGPSAIRTLFKALPADFPLPILLVLHITEQFDAAMANWLEAQCGLQVRGAADGSPCQRLAAEVCGWRRGTDIWSCVEGG